MTQNSIKYLGASPSFAFVENRTINPINTVQVPLYNDLVVMPVHVETSWPQWFQVAPISPDGQNYTINNVGTYPTSE